MTIGRGVGRRSAATARDRRGRGRRALPAQRAGEGGTLVRLIRLVRPSLILEGELAREERALPGLRDSSALPLHRVWDPRLPLETVPEAGGLCWRGWTLGMQRRWSGSALFWRAPRGSTPLLCWCATSAARSSSARGCCRKNWGHSIMSKYCVSSCDVIVLRRRVMS